MARWEATDCAVSVHVFKFKFSVIKSPVIKSKFQVSLSKFQVSLSKFQVYKSKLQVQVTGYKFMAEHCRGECPPRRPPFLSVPLCLLCVLGVFYMYSPRIT